MNILFFNSIDVACGVHQFGLNLFRILAQSTKHRFYGCAPRGWREAWEAIKTTKPDVLLYNFYPCTMPWVNLGTFSAVRAHGLKQVSIFHEVPVTGFDALIYPDPTLIALSPGARQGEVTRTGEAAATPRETLSDGSEGIEPFLSRQLNDWYAMGRPLPERRHSGHVRVRRAVPVIGSSGFGFQHKGFLRLVERVLAEFERACIRLHLPYATHGDESGESARRTADGCRSLVAGVPGIELQIDHQFLNPADYLEWLAANDLNAFLYDETPGRGIASTIDHALAVYRPIAITRTAMFRHLHGCAPSICVEDHSLTEIMDFGLEPLEAVYKQFQDETVLARVEGILERVALQKGYCRLLRDSDRAAFAPVIEGMTATLPEMMWRKIPNANVQQAWCLDLVRRVIGVADSPAGRQRSRVEKILCVGCLEDTAFEMLCRELPSTGILGIDPDITGGAMTCGFSLAEFRQQYPQERFGCVFACSVLEHVPDDEQFIRDMCDCLLPDGVGIVTCDYKADYQPGHPLPATDVRFYTPSAVERLGHILRAKGCYWLDTPDLRGDPDFVYQGHHYSFLGLVFKKL